MFAILIGSWGNGRQLSRLPQGFHIGVDVSSLEGRIDPEVGTKWTAGILGTAGVAFLATFGVAPIFKDSLKEAVSWNDDIFPQLVDQDLPSVSPLEAWQLMGKG